jgi:hypothetical protein
LLKKNIEIKMNCNLKIILKIDCKNEKKKKSWKLSTAFLISRQKVVIKLSKSWQKAVKKIVKILKRLGGGGEEGEEEGDL